MHNRLKYFIESSNLSIREFENVIGASNGVIRRFVTEGTSIKSSLLERIMTIYPQLSAEWLLRGKEPMFLQPDTRDQTTLQLIRRIEELAIENNELKTDGNDKRQTTK